jgi:peptide/nickel transport system substrate-binding protein
VQRRHFIASAAATAAIGLAAPRVARATDNRTMRFVPQAGLSNLDPIWTTIYVVRNASLLFWDTLYGVDSTLTPRPQMCAGHEMRPDGLMWTFTLRDGLKFHDNEPVLARDAVASVKRWMKRDLMGQRIAAVTDQFEALDDRRFRLRLTAPFPRLIYALAKVSTPMCFIMPERIANTDPFEQITDYVGSGPMVFRKDQWVSGSSAVFERFADYVPRDEKPDWLAGGKHMEFDRVEWQVIPDAGTAAAALQSGEVDWWEAPIPDLVPLLRRNHDIRVDIADPLGNIGVFRVNHLFPPFNDPRARQALMMATDQSDFMQAIVGSDPALWKTLAGYFPPGTPLFTENGGDVLKGPRDYAGARKLMQEAGYKGEKVVLLAATDVPPVKAQADVTADMLGRIGVAVDYQAMDWGTMTARRASMKPPSEGGWNIFHTWTAGADASSPATYPHIYCTGKKAWFGWPSSDEVQADIGAWYAAPNAAVERGAAATLNAALIAEAPFIPTGFYRGYQAWRTSLSGVVNAPFPVLWGVRKG